MPVSVLLANRAALPAVGGDVVPSVTANPTLASDGTPQVGESITQGAGTATGTPTPTPTMTLEVSANGSSGWSTQTATSNWQAADETKYFRTKVVWNNSAGSATGYSSVVGPIAEASGGGADTDVVSIGLVASATGTRNVVFGHAFAQGAVPSGRYITSDAATTQATVLSTWPDGSAKFAVVGVRDAFTNGQTKTVTLRHTATAPSGSNVAESAITSGGNSLSIALSGTNSGTVNLSSLVGNASSGAKGSAGRVDQRIAGPLFSEFRYYSPIGADNHLAAIIDVRIFADGAFWAEVAIENGWVNVASPTSKSYAAVVTINGSEKLSTGTITHCAFHRWSRDWWGSTDPQVRPAHNRSYLFGTKLVPNYVGSAPESILSSLGTSLTPFALNDFPSGDSMGSGGYDKSIGILPMWDVAYLTSGDARAFNSVLANALSYGRYTVHYRDENTLRPMQPSNYPTTRLSGAAHGLSEGGGGYDTPTAGGTEGDQWKSSHHPAPPYLAALLTGRRSHIEEVQMVTGTAMVMTSKSTWPEGRSNGAFLFCGQDRRIAWNMRDLFMMGAISDSTFREEAIDILESNLDHIKDAFVDGTSHSGNYENVLGVISQGGVTSSNSIYNNDDPNNKMWVAPWMINFQTGVLGLGYDMGLPFSSQGASDLIAVRDHAYKRMTGMTTVFGHRRAGTFELPVSAKSATFAPWLEDFAAVKAAYFLYNGSSGNYTALNQSTTTPNTTLFETSSDSELSNSSWDEGSSWTSLWPALAYAVDHQATGVDDGYRLVHGSSTYQAKRSRWSNNNPLWGIEPRRQVITPTWLSGASAWTWGTIADTDLYEQAMTTTTNPSATGTRLGIVAFSGMAVRYLNSELFIGPAGGHNDYAGNEVYSIVLSANTPAWTRRCLPSSTVRAQNNTDSSGYEADGRPTARHSYGVQHFIESLGKQFSFGAAAVWGDGNQNAATVDHFDPVTNTFSAAGTYASGPSDIAATSLSSVQDAQGNVYVLTRNGKLLKWTAASQTWSTVTTFNGGGTDNGATGAALDTTRNRILRLPTGGATGFVFDLNNSGAASAVTFTGAQSAKPGILSSLVYVPKTDRFYMYLWQEQVLYEIHPTTWAVSVKSMSGTPPAAYSNGYHDLYSRFHYLPNLEVLVVVHDAQSDIKYTKVA